MKKKIIYFIIILIFYSLGFLTHRYQLPPFYEIRFVIRALFSIPNQEFIIDENIHSQYLKNRNLALYNFEIIPNVKIVKYSPGMNIWSDRAYYNQKNDDKINNFFLIKQKRHNLKKIIINSKKDIEIIRVKCLLNNNSNYQNWKKLNYELLIIGSGCIHDKVFSKKYKAGKIIIFSGGPVASDPIFISNSISDIEIMN